jgi:predicted MFS family arabinose efflux permease
MMSSFRDYFFPMYVEPLGVSEVRIGQIYLVLGMCVLYTGPKLAELMIKLFKGKGSIVIATLLIAAGMGVFVISPSVFTAIVALAIIHVANSFAYTCQYFYFGELPIVSRFGEGNAMGVYSMFENLGQTLGPLLFGSVLTLGNRKGITVIIGILIITLILFVLLSLKKEKE